MKSQTNFYLVLLFLVTASMASAQSLVEHKTYYEDGKVKQVWTTLNDINEGYERTYYPSGKLEAENYFVSGLLQGVCKWYYESGALQAEWNYVSGKLEGTSKWYYENGKLEGVAVYSNNVVISQSDYDENGLLK